MRDWDEGCFVGGHPALDFLNTVEDQDKSRVQSRFETFEDFLSWGVIAGLFTAAEVPEIDVRGDLNGIHEMREMCFRVLRGVAAGKDLAEVDDGRLTTAIKDALSHAQLVETDGKYQWRVAAMGKSWVTDRIALWVEDLLRSDDIGRLRECGRCSWLFIDKGRGRGRRWCRMSACGNRAKTEAFRKGG